MRAPPEVPQSGRKGRASGCPRPAAAVTAPARAPPPPRVQAAPPPRRVSAAAAPAPGPPGHALRPTEEAGPAPPPGRRARPRPALAPTSAGKRVAVRNGRGADDCLPAARTPHPARVIVQDGQPARRGGVRLRLRRARVTVTRHLGAGPRGQGAPAGAGGCAGGRLGLVSCPDPGEAGQRLTSQTRMKMPAVNYLFATSELGDMEDIARH
ncbi:nascent polypeptide-associated complex subunit alpha, muscle-specific form-like [Manis pentadactyla]|uniref:nascent polypeptide-associated complex subunit alpha, muscle-specific form-like n=1 Tax=Manis pentadactyla TaxID=143292 RepID=UPI00255CEADA|nr:nascent polypeptide-associated complex subunit alpha, muscle-specific form-like [Manis pentadactyla]